MAEISVFEELAAELSGPERNALLDRIKSHASIIGDPLYGAASVPPKPEKDYSSRAAELGLFARIVFFFRRILTGKNREELMRDDDLKAIAYRMEAKSPGLVDWRRGILLYPFAEELRKLRDSARFFYDVLDRSVEQDKAAFYAFLGSIEIPETDRRLMSETDPSVAIPPGVDDSRGRSMLLDAFDRAFAELPDESRRAMYRDLRSILFLRRLSGYLFDRLIGAFRDSVGPAGEPSGALFRETRDLLLELGDILYSLRDPPSAALMESLFVFVEREELAKPGADPNAVLQSDLAKADVALGRIRAFNARVPLLVILRLVSGDPAYAPRELPGGEDWLSVYKTFWRERIERQLDAWRKDKRYRELQREINDFVGIQGSSGFVYISREERDSGPAIGLELALTFLDSFYKGPFVREINRTLKVLLVEGEFYRKDNRIEYTDAYDALLRLPEKLSAFDSRLAPDGDLGKAWFMARNEIGPSPLRKRKAQAIARSAEEEAEEIVRRAADSFISLARIVRGILKGEAGGRYDSLSNLYYIDGRANKDFLRALEKTRDRCERAHALLTELSGLDLGRAE